MSEDSIRLQGLRAGNLKNLDLELQRGSWTAVHGPSGAGKSALLFGVLEPVSRRRFEILEDPRALPGLEESWLKPLADGVVGLDPVIASAGEIPRGRKKAALVEVLDLLSLLQKAWTQEGLYQCTACSSTWRPPSVEGLLAMSERWQESSTVLVLSAASDADSAALLQAGWTRYRVGKTLARLEEAPSRLVEDAWLLLDRFKWRSGQETRLRDALASSLARGVAMRLVVDQQTFNFAAADRCPECGLQHASHAQEDWYRNLELQDRILDGKAWSTWMGLPLQEWLDLKPLPKQGRARRRLELLQRTGLGHLAGDRLLGTLSLGEARRLELVSWIAQVRRGQTVLLDEPGMGLHGKERQTVAALLQELVAQGNTVLTADPAREFLEAAHHWLALGPQGGPGGGKVVCQGKRDELPQEDWVDDPSTATQAKEYLHFPKIKARHLSMKKLSVPLGRVVTFCGVSGSGKSTLLEQEILPRLRAEENVQGKIPEGGVHSLLERALRWSPASTIATLSGVWQEVRAAFASSEEARIRGIEAGALVARPGKGACPVCNGYAIDAHHLPCTACDGLGLRNDLLDLRLRNRPLRDWLTTPLDKLEKRLPAKGRLRNTVRHLIALGMGNRTLGERGRFLSLGERGRIALARVLSTARPGAPKLFLLDEPCLGLPVQEARRVVQLLRELCKDGHSFWVVEHHEYLLRSADWMMEIGPGAGAEGGQLIYQGKVEGVLKKDTPTGHWLVSRRRTELEPPLPPPRQPLRSRRFEEDVERSGRHHLEKELARELAMRSPLLHDLVGVEAEERATSSAQMEEDWTPAAWPVDPPRGTHLAEVLGLAAPIQKVLETHGSSVCAGCGGGGPWLSFEQAARTLSKTDDLIFATPLPYAFLARKEHSAWLQAAGFRRFLRGGKTIRWRREEQEPLQSGDLVWLDRFNPLQEDAVGRLRDIAHHAALLGEGKALAVDPNSFKHQWHFHPESCRDCERANIPMEARLGTLKASELEGYPLRDVLRVCAEQEDIAPLFVQSLELLAGTSLLSRTVGHTWTSLTDLEKQAARLAGWLLNPLQGVVLLADQPLSGLPPAIAKRFATRMLKGDSIFHFTDPEGWALESTPTAKENLLLDPPMPFPMPFSMKEWCDPPRAKADVDLRSALSVEGELSSYFQKSETARLNGWGPEDLDVQRSAHRCPVCLGKRRIWLHPEWSLSCRSCHGTGWSSAMAALEERGVRWMDLGHQKIADLQQLFADHPRLNAVFTWASEFGLGSFELDAPLRGLPRGTRMLAPFATWMASAADVGPASSGGARVGLALAGWIPLEAEQISSRIAGFPFAHSGHEWREHHPLFAT
ncbi:MAG: ATP-binding cassette domain-containing protein [Planctomycetota bacterium]|nr:ATP-binding cassette domain-containing protein [Planctomycetota bacterium]